MLTFFILCGIVEGRKVSKNRWRDVKVVRSFHIKTVMSTENEPKKKRSKAR